MATERRFAGIAIALMAAAWSVQAADSTSDRDSKIAAACKAALAGKGYRDVEVREPRVLQNRSGYVHAGEFTRDGKRYEFSCVLTLDLKVAGLDVDPA